MLEKLDNGRKVVGTRRLLKALEKNEVAMVYLAMDADLFIIRQVKDAALKANVRITEVNTMKELGKACSVEVPTASAGLLK